MIPDEMVERLASEIARRSGYDPNAHDTKAWQGIRDFYRETAKQYLRVAMGYSTEFDFPGESTFNSETGEIKGTDENWYEVPDPVLVRYMLSVGFAGANLSQFAGGSIWSDENLDKLCEKLYAAVYRTVDDKSKQAFRNGLKLAMQEALAK